MLKKLSISNYALIESQNIEFNSGFSIITGETGAGKSILLGALSLILGQRADVSILQDKTKKCVIEGVFDISRYNIQTTFKTHDIDYEDLTYIRRIINPNGKSRAFINDLPVTLNIAKEIGAKLIDIHSQHNNLLLNNSDFQFYIIDTYANHAKLLNDYQTAYNNKNKKEKELKKLKETAWKSKEEIDFLNFQFNELEAANLKPKEQEELEKEAEILSHTEEITKNLSEIHQQLNNEDISVLHTLQNCLGLSKQIEPFFDAAQEYSTRLESVFIELNDMTSEIETQSESINHDPEKLEHVKLRLDSIYRLQQKHKVTTIQQLIDLHNELKNKLDNFLSFDNQITRLENEINNINEKVNQIAKKLTQGRKKAIPKIQSYIEKTVKLLGITNARVVIEQTKTDAPNIKGNDNIRFTFSANKQSETQDIAKVASGGEISRIMLSIKSLISDRIALPTIIFDEIDSGVSGDIADKIGSLIKKMSDNIQILNITHLPQVAAKGDYHYLVYKNTTSTKTITGIKQLTDDERITEIAKMLSGKTISQAALSNAKELLQN